MADAILDRAKADIVQVACGDPVLLFAIRRRTFARLMYWERGTPADRRKVQKAKYVEQDGICALCARSMDLQGSEMDRTDPLLSYTVGNVRLVRHTFHIADQKRKGFA